MGSWLANARPDVLPPPNDVIAMKRLIICCDGTWNTPDQKDGDAAAPSNVAKFVRALRSRDHAGAPQIVFYSRGVGTRPGIDKWTGGAFGHGLAANVQDAYRFIVNNYEEGDELSLFGFSRGAYTARSVVGYIRNSGLLRRQFRHMHGHAYELYRSRKVHPDDDEARAFRSKYSIEPRIRLLGVWDTVGALGIPIRSLNWITRHRYQFHDVRLSRIVDNACHAVAIDEQRRQFKPALWEIADAADAERVKQVWFAGVHCNVGGGYADAGLSDLALQWMIECADKCGLMFDDTYVREHITPNALAELRESRRGLYKLSRRHIRPIGSGTVHPSVIERHAAELSPRYASDNFVAWLRAQEGVAC